MYYAFCLKYLYSDVMWCAPSPPIGSRKGATMCYTRLNVVGDAGGNCGHSSTAFQRCAARYVCESSRLQYTVTSTYDRDLIVARMLFK